MDYDFRPYYSTYGIDNALEHELENSRDLVYFRRLYSRTMNRIQQVIDDECDKMEYDGSMMFDQYPDKLSLERLRDKIYEKVKGENTEDCLKDVVSVMLCNEMHRRRVRRRRHPLRWL